MFGQKDSKDENTGTQDEDTNANDNSAQTDNGTNQVQPDHPGEALTAVSGEGVGNPAAVASAAVDPANLLTGDLPWQHPGTPTDGNSPADRLADIVSPAGGYPSAPSTRISTSSGSLLDPVDDFLTTAADGDDNDKVSSAPVLSGADVSDAELVEIKQKALNELLPLIDKLDQPPEEKFRTIMMMIQASDNEGLVAKAYEAAHSIPDEKARAQALLDIVNEINYFTQHPAAETPEPLT